jgi:glycerol uptake facilitator protein
MTLGVVLVYISGQLIGAFLGAVGCWFAYKQHFDAEPEPRTSWGVRPGFRSYGWNVITEVIGTFVLVFVVIISFGQQPGTPAGPLPDLLPSVPARRAAGVGIGASLGGPTGYRHQPGP